MALCDGPKILLRILAVFLFLSVPGMAAAQDLPVDQQLPPVSAPTRHVEVGQLAVLNTIPQFDPQSATDIWLARVGGDARAKSDAYFEGGYYLQILDLTYGLVIAALLLWLQISARISDWAQERTHSRAYQVMLYFAVYISAVTFASLPLSIYEGFVREHAYGLSNQTFLQWGEDFATSFALTLIAGLVVLPILYAMIRAAREIWWLWGAGLAIAVMVIGLVISPVAIQPLFNHYSALPDSPLKNDILSLARANGVPANNVWLVDESRQSDRISANVSGFLGTTRISLNDNLLNKGTHDEVLAVLGHEMGHYVMDHTTRLLLLLGLVIIAGFGFVAWSFGLAISVFGGNWQVRQPDDVAGLPLLVALMSIFMFLATPLTNSIVRTTEQQADTFGVNAVRKPDAFASVVLKLSAYRKLDPAPWEEVIFYDHPSGRSRIAAVMQWKKEHIGDVDIRDSVPENPR
jgi:STE24 endopeptidase